MTWEETDTLVHFYEDQDKNLYMKLPGTSLWKVRKERQERLRKALKEIGYQPTPIQHNGKYSWRGSKMMSLTKKELYNRLLITRDIDDIYRYRKTVDDVLKWLKLDLEKGDEW